MILKNNRKTINNTEKENAMPLIRIQEYLDNAGKTIEKAQDSTSEKLPYSPKSPDKNKSQWQKLCLCSSY